MPKVFLFSNFLKKVVFIFKERRGEEEREGDKHNVRENTDWLVLCMHPDQGLNLQSGYEP